MNHHHRERECVFTVPMKRHASTDDDDSTGQLDHLQIQCVQWIDYILEQQASDPFFLSDLEVILDSGNLDVYCSSRINGIDYSVPSVLIKKILIQTMSNRCGFKSRHSRLPGHAPPPKSVDLACQFYLQKGSVTIPLTYMLGQPAPHGKLKSIWIKFDMESKKPEDLVRSFQLHVNGLGNEYLSEANRFVCSVIERGLSILFCHHLGQRYPLVFSQTYVEKLAGATQHIPILARSLYRVLNIAEVTKRKDFVKKAMNHIEQMRQKIAPLQPRHWQTQQESRFSEAGPNSMWEDLVVGLYYATKRADSLRQHHVVIKGNSEANVVPSLAVPPSNGTNQEVPTMPIEQDFWADI